DRNVTGVQTCALPISSLDCVDCVWGEPTCVSSHSPSTVSDPLDIPVSIPCMSTLMRGIHDIRLCCTDGSCHTRAGTVLLRKGPEIGRAACREGVEGGE